jgi:RNA polymerase sigma-70 factor (ECF subfamily)
MNRTKMTDTELVSSYRRGDNQAFAHLVSKYQSKVYTAIYLIIRDRYVAEDLTQDVFIKAIDKIVTGKYNDQGKFGPWILRVAHNLAVDNFRKIKRCPEIIMEDGSPLFNKMDFAESSIEEVKILSETNASLRALIDTLPETQREVLIMRHFEDMSFQEIAKKTGVGMNTALGRMRYALVNLRKKINEIEEAYDKKLYPS